MRKAIQNNPLIFIIIIYVLARGFMLLINGVWWDDWIIWNAPRETIVQTWVTEGNTPHLAAIHLFLYDHFTPAIIPFLYRCIAFSSGIISILLLWAILRQFNLSQNWRFAIMALVASSPMNTADITLCCLMYNISTPLFYAGTLFFLKSIPSRNLAFKILAAGFFFLSLFYWMSAIVLIPCIVLIVALWQVAPTRWSCENIKAVVFKCLSWWYIWIVPIAYWIVRSVFFAPKDQFAQYYSINLKAIVMLPLILIQSLIKNVFGLLRYDFQMADGGILPTVLLIILVCLIIGLVRKADQTGAPVVAGTAARNMFWMAVILFAGAMIPTVLIGDTIGDRSNFHTIQSRYQVLMLFPVSLFLYIGISQFRGGRFRQFALGIVVALSVFATIRTYIQYQRGWFKELAVAQVIRQESRLHVPHVNVVVNDLTEDWNEYPDLSMPDYAFTGISNLALDRDQTHRYVTKAHYAQAVAYDPRKDNYTIVGAEKSRNPSSFQYVLTLYQRAEDALSLSRVLKLTLLQYTDPVAFSEAIANVMTYTLIPIDRP